MRKTLLLALFCAAVLALNSKAATAQSNDEPLFDALEQHFKRDELSLGVLVQAVTDLQIERSFAGRNGFSMANLRLLLYGELDQGFGYFVAINAINTPGILDARLYYQVSPALRLSIGQFKAPFSAEFLTYAGSIDFVNRSQVVANLAPGRQIGFEVSGKLADKTISYAAGLFNGNGTARNNNDNNDFLYAGRLTFYPHDPAANHVEIGLNAAFSNDNISGLTRKRTLLGADFRMTRDKLLLSGEVIWARWRFSESAISKPWGYHATAGYMVTPKSQLLLRWESLLFDSPAADSRLLVFGYNLWPTKATELQINYLINTDDADFDRHQLLINAQLAF